MQFCKKTTGILFFFLVSTVWTFAQLNSNNLVHYGEMDGTIIYDVMPDRQGNIWMATQNGLVCFNGYEFKRFFPDSNDSTSISNILTFSLFEDHRGRIWIGGMESIDLYDPYVKRFKHYPLAGLTDFPVNSQPIVLAITEDRSGKVFFGVTSAFGIRASGALLYYDEGNDRLRRFETPDSLLIENIGRSISDADGNIWHFSYNGILKYDSAGYTRLIPYNTELMPERVAFRNFKENEWDEMIWTAVNDSLIYCYSPVNNSFHSFSLHYLFKESNTPLITYCIIKDAGKNLWIGTNHGLINYDREQDSFSIFSQGQDKVHERASINCLDFDSFGNLWIGTSSEGLLKLNNQTVFNSITANFDEDSELKPGWIINLNESADGKIWFTSVGEGVNFFLFYEMDPVSHNIKRHEYRNIIPGLNVIYAFIEASPGKWLVFTNLGMFYYFPGTDKMKKIIIEGFPDEISVNKFYKDRQDQIWILSSNGLFLIENERVTREYDLQKWGGTSVASNSITDMFESRQDGYWLLTSDGLYFLDIKEDKIERKGFDKSKGDVFISQDINSFCEGQDGIVWVGTWLGGLCRYNTITGDIKTYTNVNGLPSISIQGILAEDNNKILWISTFEGLCRFDIEKEQFDNYSLEDGIQGRLFAENSSLKSTRGIFYFGGSNGLTYFNPDGIEKNSIPPKVYITDFKIAGVSVPFPSDSNMNEAIYNDQEFRLKFFQNNISITYIGIHYGNPSRNKFAYKLENYDDSWREVSNQRTAYYYNLPAGDYIFRVKSANSNGLWNEEGASMHVVITPPWWRSWWAYSIYGLLVLGLVLTLDRVQRRRVINRERAMIKEKELAQAREIEKAYHKLQTTQTQLIHAEKMASLGELTAGIAHEIQNPLNFVNNFSEVSTEMLKEMDAGLDAGDIAEAKLIVRDLQENLEKITVHGRRASSIVKGMLEHSRSNTGHKELTDINSLADEYIRLAYHGFRARDKSFNSNIESDLQANLPSLNVVPQEIGRVLLNLISNAFYAVSSKAKQSPVGYAPTVKVSTRRVKDKIEIRVKDNGIGIPEEIREKIFQPFFTTKPTGEGTGLGLSLSFDIITKGHQGEMKVETKEGEGSEFIILIPVGSEIIHPAKQPDSQ